jgi:hypothetical protein
MRLILAAARTCSSIICVMFAVLSQEVFNTAAAAGNCKTHVLKLDEGGFPILALITQNQSYANALFA